MSLLTTIPAFGFETDLCNAGDVYKKIYQERNEKLLDFMKESPSGISPDDALVLEVLQADDDLFREVSSDFVSQLAKHAWKIANIVKVLGYIPLVGTLVGIHRISKTLKATEEELPNKYSHIARGTVESFSLGFLLVIPDLILTAYRNTSAEWSGRFAVAAIPV